MRSRLVSMGVRMVVVASLVGCVSRGQPSGPPGEVRAIVSLDGGRTGTALAVSDFDGVRTITDDAAGTVAFTVTPPASVTWVIGGAYHDETVVGVEPGDVICFVCPAPPTTVATTISVPARASAASYSFGNGDELHAGAADPQVELRTETTGPHDVLVLANDANGAPVAWTAALGQILDGGTLALPDAWHPVDTFTAVYDGLPAAPLELHLYYGEMSAASVRPAFASPPSVAAVDGPHASVPIPRADLGGPLMTVISQFWGHGFDQINAVRVIAPTAPTLHVDAAQLLLPWITDVAYDAGSRTVSWHLTAGGAAGELDGDDVSVQLEWLTPDGVTGQWHLIAPPGSTSATFPELPAGGPPDHLTRVSVELDDYRDVQTYAQLRSSTTTTPDARDRASLGSTSY